MQLCTSGGRLTGRFEHDPGEGGLDLDGGGIAQLQLPLPERALSRWP